MPSELGDLQLGSLLIIVMSPLDVCEVPEVWTPVDEVDEPVEDDDEVVDDDVVDEEDEPPVTVLEDADDPLPAFPVTLALLPTTHCGPLNT